MQLTVDVPDRLLKLGKALADVERDVRHALVLYWLARGEIGANDARGLLGSTDAETFSDFLSTIPDVGDDADFARPTDAGRPEGEWGT